MTNCFRRRAAHPTRRVLPLAAHVNHGVNGAAPAEKICLRHNWRAAIELRLRNVLMHFEIVFPREIFHVSRRHLHKERLARATTLKQKDAGPPIADQSRSGDTTGRAPSNHNEIEVVGHRRLPVASDAARARGLLPSSRAEKRLPALVSGVNICGPDDHIVNCNRAGAGQNEDNCFRDLGSFH
jgi:hypothetical protein